MLGLLSSELEPFQASEARAQAIHLSLNHLDRFRCVPSLEHDSRFVLKKVTSTSGFGNYRVLTAYRIKFAGFLMIWALTEDRQLTIKLQSLKKSSKGFLAYSSCISLVKRMIFQKTRTPPSVVYRDKSVESYTWTWNHFGSHAQTCWIPQGRRFVSNLIRNCVNCKRFTTKSVQSYVADHGIKWFFVTEKAPWRAGFHERLISLVKHCLRRCIGRKLVSEKDFTTLLIEVEAVLNARPLTYQSENADDLRALTPADFLHPGDTPIKPGVPILAEDGHEAYVPKGDPRANLMLLWERSLRLLDLFWKQWQEEYLLSLRERQDKLYRNRIDATPAIGDLVLIHDDNLPRGSWAMARVIELIPSPSDGLIREVKIKTATGTLNRAPRHLYPLEMNMDPLERHADEPEMPLEQINEQAILDEPEPMPTAPATKHLKSRDKWPSQLQPALHHMGEGIKMVTLDQFEDNDQPGHFTPFAYDPDFAPGSGQVIEVDEPIDDTELGPSEEDRLIIDDTGASPEPTAVKPTGTTTCSISVQTEEEAQKTQANKRRSRSPTRRSRSKHRSSKPSVEHPKVRPPSPKRRPEAKLQFLSLMVNHVVTSMELTLKFQETSRCSRSREPCEPECQPPCLIRAKPKCPTRAMTHSDADADARNGTF
ncbi:hypothetical protein DdX_10896 [Ditylenchus destructor]|uniref:DUF5641 domain-containing protein n=1 Tax=Ditylenchus destructor TaxID=166010 RepID=A0AAD4R573_9BILA|nr:hypothetical protein DdX_10896 [Ditylenchus destructor]